MAFRRLVCSECGAEVAPHDAYCGGCGVKLDAVPAAASGGAAACRVCGHANAAGASYCESCGARLAAAPTKKTAARTTPSKADRRRFEPWQIVSFIAVAALLVYFVYTQVESPSAPVSRPVSGAPSSAAPLKDFTRFEQAIAANPKDTSALLGYANALFDVGAFPRAITLYERYLELNPSDPNARVDLGICKFELGKIDSVDHVNLFAGAIRDMETALQGSPGHQPAAFNLGVVHLTMGNVTESTRWFTRAVELNPSSDLGLRAKRILDQHASITPQRLLERR